MNYDNETTFLNACLEQDEYVLWKDKPGKGNLFSGKDRAMLPFALIWLTFSLFFESLIIKAGAPISFVVFGSIFVLIGLYLLYVDFFSESICKG